MKLALYVHDFRLEVGHSNSLIELIRHLPENISKQIEEIEVVSNTTTPLNELFPNFQGKLRWVKVPFAGMKPSIVKSIYFQIWTFLYNRFFQSPDIYRIGIGICSLDVHAISIQFIHHQWTEKGLELESAYPFRKYYKKILFAYFHVCENYLFPKKNIKLFSPALFLTDFLKTKYPGINANTIYSGVNLNRFELNGLTKTEIKNDLVRKYPILKELDVSEPIYLFVGAYERKGLDRAIELLKEKKGAQFIVIGSPSMGKVMRWPECLKVFPIKFSSEIAKFYSLADIFLFPTIYEPFGLVLFEAMAMGLGIITFRSGVGASELLSGLPEIYFADEVQFQFPTVSVKGFDEKKLIREERIKSLGNVSWEKAGEELASFLFPE